MTVNRRSEIEEVERKWMMRDVSKLSCCFYLAGNHNFESLFFIYKNGSKRISKFIKIGGMKNVSGWRVSKLESVIFVSCFVPLRTCDIKKCNFLDHCIISRNRFQCFFDRGLFHFLFQ